MLVLIMLLQSWAAAGTASEYPYVRCAAEKVFKAAATENPEAAIAAAEKDCVQLRAASIALMKNDYVRETNASLSEVQSIPTAQLETVTVEQVRHMLRQIISEKRSAAVPSSANFR
ncbi:hypothetical protein [Sphingomonas prati]|uniref:Uncharacterized protein n=1 Tax=Sphingomonas prati TaxID=1843237 RepID=A0A7W9F074_9SPHN|nr:hypothetical protein [Sphingomonas prati]MBB5727938.1 hypothetical protein [Sphingomonas prati]GGE82019.1 hypothetical protein GCM10011404_13330 [Sphingomonas prati]